MKLHIHNNYYLCVYTKFDKLLYFVILVISIITFIKFINFIKSLFGTNMKSMKEEIKVKEYNEQELFIILEKIEKNTRKQDK